MNTKNKIITGAGTIATILAATMLLILPTTGIADTMINIDIPIENYHKGDNITIDINCTPSSPIKAWETKISFDENKLIPLIVNEGTIFDGYETFYNAGDIKTGCIENMYNLILGKGNTTTPGSLVRITFLAIECGETTINLYDTGITNETQYLPYTTSNSTIFIYSSYDINCDKTVNLQDLILTANHYGETGTPGWIPEDTNHDGKIKILDLVLIVFHWGNY